MKKVICFFLGITSSVLFSNCTGKIPLSLRDDSSLGLRITGFNKAEYLWHSGFDLSEGDWDLYMGTQTEIPPTVGPLANYDLFSFRKVSFGMSYQELIATLGDPSEQWTIPIPEKNEETIKDLPSNRLTDSSRHLLSLELLNVPAFKKYLDHFLVHRSVVMQSYIVAMAKTGRPMFLYFNDYPEFVFYVATVKLPIGINPDRREYNTVSFLQDIYDLHALGSGASGFPLISFPLSNSKNVYKIRNLPDRNGKKVEKIRPMISH